MRQFEIYYNQGEPKQLFHKIQVKARAVELAKAMENEDGVTGAVKAFLKHLPRKKPEAEQELGSPSFFSLSKCFGCA